MDGWAYQSTAFLATKAVPQAVLAWLQGFQNTFSRPLGRTINYVI